MHSCPFLLSMRNYLVTLSPTLLFIAIFVIKMLIYLQISTTVLFKVNLCLSSNLNWYIGRKLWDYCKNRKNKILFFNLWFVLFCEITDKWGKLYLWPHWLSKKPLGSVLLCPLKTHLVLFLALGALFGFCIVNQTSCSESFVTLQWRRVSTLILTISLLLVSGSLLLESERVFWKQVYS